MFYLLSGVVLGFFGVCVWYTLCAAIGRHFWKKECIKMFVFFGVLATVSSFGSFLYDTYNDTGYTLTVHTYPIEMVNGQYVTTVGNTTHILTEEKLFGQKMELNIPKSKVWFQYGNTPKITVFVHKPNTFSTFEKVMFLHRDTNGSGQYANAVVSLHTI